MKARGRTRSDTAFAKDGSAIPHAHDRLFPADRGHGEFQGTTLDIKHGSTLIAFKEDYFALSVANRFAV
jgi:hypothetical protein